VWRLRADPEAVAHGTAEEEEEPNLSDSPFRAEDEAAGEKSSEGGRRLQPVDGQQTDESVDP